MKLIDEDPLGWFSVDPNHVFISGFDIDPPEGYKKEDNFPKCCTYHKTLFEHSKNWFKKFPDCCDSHRELARRGWFSKEKFSHLPMKLVNQVTYTKYFINHTMEADDWYRQIVFYIEHNHWSFGHPSVGFDHYLSDVKYFIQNQTSVSHPKYKQDKLVKYIESYYLSNQKCATKDSSFDYLLKTYQNWLKIFPFEIQYFAKLRDHFERQTPLLAGKPRLNPFNGLARAKLLTPEQLIQRLNSLTQDLIKKVNGRELYKQDLIPDVHQHAIDLLGEQHRIRQAAMFGELSVTEPHYVTILEKWLEIETDYFKGVVTIIGQRKAPPKGTTKGSGKLEDWFKRPQDYKTVMNALVTKGYCQPETFLWIDKTNGNKGFLISIIKHLQTLGYYSGNVCPTHEEIILIAQNSFGVKVGLDSVKRSQRKTQKLDFLPPSG